MTRTEKAAQYAADIAAAINAEFNADKPDADPWVTARANPDGTLAYFGYEHHALAVIDAESFEYATLLRVSPAARALVKAAEADLFAFEAIGYYCEGVYDALGL